MLLQAQPSNYTFGWDADTVRALRQHLGFSQSTLAQELGVRQQTVSEWETGAYRPRGASSRLLTIVAREAGFTPDHPSADDDYASSRFADESALRAGFSAVMAGSGDS